MERVVYLFQEEENLYDGDRLREERETEVEGGYRVLLPKLMTGPQNKVRVYTLFFVFPASTANKPQLLV